MMMEAWHEKIEEEKSKVESRSASVVAATNCALPVQVCSHNGAQMRIIRDPVCE